MFTVIHSGIFVGTGVPDGPNNTQNLFCIFVEVYTFTDRILCKIFHFVTDRRGRRSLQSHKIRRSASYHKFPFILPLSRKEIKIRIAVRVFFRFDL